MSSSVESGDVKAFSRDKVKLCLNSGMMVNDATMIRANVIGSNGIVHVHDKVILLLQFDEIDATSAAPSLWPTKVNLLKIPSMATSINFYKLTFTTDDFSMLGMCTA